MMVHVPEDKLRSLMDLVGSVNPGATGYLDYILKKGNVFKSAGLTPMYIMDEEDSSLVVISEEFFDKKFH